MQLGPSQAESQCTAPECKPGMAPALPEYRQCLMLCEECTFQQSSCLQHITSEPGMAPALPGLRQNSMRCAKPNSPEAAPISSTCLKAARPSSDFTPQEAAAALQAK